VNKEQKFRLWAGIVVIVLMGIFPPTPSGCGYVAFYGGMGKTPGPVYYEFHYGYTFLFSAKASDIAFNKLIIQWGIAGAVTFGLIYILRDKKPEKQNFCLWAGIVVIVLMGIFPPGRHRIPPWRLRFKPAHYGYTFLLSANASDIAFKKLIIRWGIAGAATFGLFYIFRDKNLKGRQKELKYPEE
jgi:hypothetical protein